MVALNSGKTSRHSFYIVPAGKVDVNTSCYSLHNSLSGDRSYWQNVYLLSVVPCLPIQLQNSNIQMQIESMEQPPKEELTDFDETQ